MLNAGFVSRFPLAWSTAVMRHFFAVVLLASALASAERPKVVLVPFGTGEGATETQAAKFTRLVGDELKNREEVDLVPAPATRVEKAAPAAAKKSGSAAEATFAFEAGKKALADLKFEDAMAQLKKGIEASLSDPASCDFPAVIDATISLAAAAFRAGDEHEAKNALVTLARLDPNYQLPQGYPPVFTREFEKAKKKVDKSPKGSINVDGPGGATAFVDGRDLGMVPVLEENLAAGTHYVKVEGTHGEKFGQTVEVKAGTVKVKANFPGAPKEKEGGPVVEPRIAASIDEETKRQVAAYAKAAGAEYALVAHIYRTGEAQLTAGPALYSAKKGGFVALLPVAFDDAVLTATVEAFKVADGVQQRISSFGSVTDLPLSLLSKSAVRVAAKGSGKASNPEDVETVTPERKSLKARDAEKTDLGPTDNTVRKFDQKSTLVDDGERRDTGEENPPGGEVKKGVPAWVWIVAGVAVAAGAGVGGYFGYKEATKPVTGTVTATW